jgi:propanol-preferring alcohol dehydrogenase
MEEDHLASAHDLSWRGEESTDQAAVVRDFTAPLTIEDRPVPEPGAHQVRVRVEACGLCHTDIHAARGDWPVKPTPPFVPGHEGVGIVEAAGSEVRHVRIGQRAAIPWLVEACGRCDYCGSGWETLCLEQRNSGYSVDGGMRKYALAHGDYVVPVPESVDRSMRYRSPVPG